MITRTAKILLLAGIALFYTLVVFNNVTDLTLITSSCGTCCRWIRLSRAITGCGARCLRLSCIECFISRPLRGKP